MSTRILVVDDHEPLRQNVVAYLRAQEGIEEVSEATNGAEALQLLKAAPYDVVVTDLVMPMMDGYTLLDHIRQMPMTPPPKIIITSALSKESIISHAIDLGANFYLVKPYEPAHLLGHIREMTNGRRASSTPSLTMPEPRQHMQTLDERLGALLLTIGIPAHIKGYQFLRCGIKLVIEQPDLINRITKELYPTIAKRFNTSASKVERAIRHAIEVAWNRGRVDTLNHIFGCRVCTQEDRPTNGEFIAMIADKLSLERSA